MSPKIHVHIKNGISLLLLIYVLVLFDAVSLFAIETQAIPSKPARSTEYKSSRPYCGLSCLYTVIKSTSKEIEFQHLVRPEYLASHKGSSLKGLKKASEDHGLYAEVLSKLNTQTLKKSTHPIILHVKADEDSIDYDHYVLFLGTKNGRAQIFDPPRPIELVPFYELAPRWNGYGLIISSTPIDLQTILVPIQIRFMIYAVIAIIAILALHWARRWLPKALLNSRRKLLGLSAAQGAALGIAALLAAFVYHFANNEGFLANANATASIQQAHLGNFIPKVSEKKVHKLLDSDTVFIDARFARDFKAGHLEGAINVPVDANDVEHQKVTADIAKDTRIVLYCQSAGCKFAEIVAIKLISDGFSNISIFRGGWQEWVAKNGKTKEVAI